MPSVSIKKADKLHALQAMVHAKFMERYKKLMDRRRAVTQRVYDNTVGREGNFLKAQAKRQAENWQYWLEHKGALCLPDMPLPGLIVQPPGKLRRGYLRYEIMSGPSAYPLDPQNIHQQLDGAVAWPRMRFGNEVYVEKADAATKKVAATLERDILGFNEDLKAFYDEAHSIVMYLRTSKQIDDKFPELWKYLPDGVRERIKQAVVALDQATVDEFRKKLR